MTEIDVKKVGYWIERDCQMPLLASCCRLFFLLATLFAFLLYYFAPALFLAPLLRNCDAADDIAPPLLMPHSAAVLYYTITLDIIRLLRLSLASFYL